MERYRRLRTKMIQQHAIKPFRSVVVASPGAQEGKTVTVCNLAIIFSMLPEYRVLVVDGDLRRHELTTQTGLIGQPGFGNLLDGSAHLDEVLHPCTDFPFFVIGSGNSETPAAELLHSPRMKMLTELMKDRFNLILIDSCPVNLIADTQLLASYADAVLMVARCFTTSSRELEKAANDLRQFRVIGAVLNSGTQSQLYGGKNVYY